MNPDTAQGAAGFLQVLTSPAVLPAALWLLAALIAGAIAMVTFSLWVSNMLNRKVGWEDMKAAIAEAARTITKNNAFIHDEMAASYQRSNADCTERFTRHTEETASHLRGQAKDIATLNLVATRTDRQVEKIGTALVMMDTTGKVKDVING